VGPGAQLRAPAARNKQPAARGRPKPFAVREAKGPDQGAWRVANQNRMPLAAKLRTNPRLNRARGFAAFKGAYLSQCTP